MSLLRGRRYNRLKKTYSEAGSMKGALDKMSEASTAQTLADQHGVTEKTIRRDGQFAEADILSGAVDAPKQAIVEAAIAISCHFWHSKTCGFSNVFNSGDSRKH
jgi:hypothetical protein